MSNEKENKDKKKDLSFGFITFKKGTYTPFQKLVELCEKEDWGDKNQSLMNYFNDYAKIIENKDKYISYNTSKTKCCFNIGLHTKRFKDIFACCNIDKNGEKIFEDFYTEANRWLSDLDLPKPHIFDVNFDVKLEFRYDEEHILENKDRIPQDKRESDRGILANIKDQAETLKKLLEREPHNLSNLIVPIYYRGKICFLFPIFLTDDSAEPEILLTCEKQSNTSYMFKTILTPDMPAPYRYARVIAKPNVEWLKPIGRY